MSVMLLAVPNDQTLGNFHQQARIGDLAFSIHLLDPAQEVRGPCRGRPLLPAFLGASP
jgi:hypothetical protein